MSTLSWLNGSVASYNRTDSTRIFKTESVSKKTNKVWMAVKMNAARIILPQYRQAHQIFIIVTVIFFQLAVFHPTTAIVRRSDEEDTGEIVNKVVCQGQTLKIRCPNASYALSIHSGSYGRTQPGNIVCPYVGSENDFYYNCGENVVTDKLVQICKRKKKCIFKVGEAVFGDPCRGHAYLTIIYSCVKRKRRKKPKTTSPTTNRLHPSTTTNICSTLNCTMNLGEGRNVSINSTFINNNVGNVLSATKNGNGPGILMSIIIWFVFVTTNSRSFLIVFLITLGCATLFFLIIFGLIILHGRFKAKRRKKKKLDNFEAQQQKLNTLLSANCDAKKNGDTLSNTFTAPPPSLPPPPDDMMYPSPSPDMINSSRPPPPAMAIRGRSLDDISKVGQDTKKHVTVKRSISLRTTRPDYQHKDVNFDKLPNIDGGDEIQAVIIQRNNGSTMYMNPMYENGHMKEATC